MRRLSISRRRCLEVGGMAAASLIPLQLLSSDNPGCAPPIPNGQPANSGPCPYPIPWLDKNRNHNQMPKPNVELSRIFHFKGKLARCARFTGKCIAVVGTGVIGASWASYYLSRCFDVIATDPESLRQRIWCPNLRPPADLTREMPLDSGPHYNLIFRYQYEGAGHVQRPTETETS